MVAVNVSNHLPEPKVSPEQNKLALRLTRQIEGSGPISVAEYMREANSEYYNRADPLGVSGDFITAPEISQMFGELIGLWLADLWLRQNRPANCHYVELGPGRGTLAADALRAMARFELEPPVHFVETSQTLMAKQMRAVPNATFHALVEDLPYEEPLLIIANEFFDALPIRQMVATHSGWRERVVARDRGTKFMVMPGSHAVDHLVPVDLRNAPAHSVYETSPDASTVMYELMTRLAKQGGVLLIVDYGYAQPGLGSTLQAVKNHQFTDPFDNPGDCDLTAHVNFLELMNLARMRDLRISGAVDQGDWLSALGINQRAATLAEGSPEKSDAIFSARNRLVNGDEMGSLFKIIAITSQNWPVPEGFERAID
jgi:NADH dehydrogenase [ubiquinone] 1 alpha subcomplex assembly factor 7